MKIICRLEIKIELEIGRNTRFSSSKPIKTPKKQKKKKKINVN